MAQSADQTAVTRVITVQQRKLLVGKVEKKDRGIELFNLMIAAPNWAEVRCIVERKVVFPNGFRCEPGSRVRREYSSADQRY